MNNCGKHDYQCAVHLKSPQILPKATVEEFDPKHALQYIEIEQASFIEPARSVEETRDSYFWKSRK